MNAARLRLLERAAPAVVRELQARCRISSPQAGTTVALLLECWWRTGSVDQVLLEVRALGTHAGCTLQDLVGSIARIEWVAVQPGPRSIRAIANRLRAVDGALDEVTARRTATAIQPKLLELRREMLA